VLTIIGIVLAVHLFAAIFQGMTINVLHYFISHPSSLAFAIPRVPAVHLFGSISVRMSHFALLVLKEYVL
jgi:hypothetical protein